MIQVVVIEARGHGHVLKCARTMLDADADHVAHFKAQVSSFFRVQFGEWAEGFTSTVRLVAKF